MKNNRKANQQAKSALSLKLAKRLYSVVGTALAFGLLFVVTYDVEQVSERNLMYATSMDDALSQAFSEDKQCFVLFYADYCYPCDRMERMFAEHPRLMEVLNSNYTLYKINASDSFTGGDELAQSYQVDEFPTCIITDASGREVKRITDEFDPDILSEHLFAAHELRTIPTSMDNAMTFEAADMDAMESLLPNGEGLEPEFGLIVGNFSTYSQAKEAAISERRKWNGAIYIQPEGSHEFKLIIGPFTDKDEAKATRSFLKIWEQEKTQLVKLKHERISLDVILGQESQAKLPEEH
ncbi:thioredoxin family protein [Pontibacter sp. G13]|uniref:thioredoxin family protein n=1 Tax=Pontibacter sp. G13 TaxID=3074898 RepID=UPI00288AF46D|nr:thioredoxin family protein [Pontibacter sp. G13]WNJ19336.1 thioredoxin family protein [Pontibacter sp. G13]